MERQRGEGDQAVWEAWLWNSTSEASVDSEGNPVLEWHYTVGLGWRGQDNEKEHLLRWHCFHPFGHFPQKAHSKCYHPTISQDPGEIFSLEGILEFRSWTSVMDGPWLGPQGGDARGNEIFKRSDWVKLGHEGHALEGDWGTILSVLAIFAVAVIKYSNKEKELLPAGQGYSPSWQRSYNSSASTD